MTGKANKTGDPVSKARGSSGEQLAKRFYKRVTVSEGDEGFSVLLDGRPVRTPSKRLLKLSSRSLAELIASEFDAQADYIKPLSMPATRLANTTIDGVADDPQPLIEDILRFAGTDLVCYRAGHPEGLVERQNAAWDPVVDWVRSTVGANMVLAEGVMHVEQRPEAIAAIGGLLRKYTDPFEVAGLHVITTLTGSALLSLGFGEGAWSADEAWQAAHVDEDWNISQWGEDAEAASKREQRRVEMTTAAKFVRS